MVEGGRLLSGSSIRETPKTAATSEKKKLNNISRNGQNLQGWQERNTRNSANSRVWGLFLAKGPTSAKTREDSGAGGGFEGCAADLWATWSDPGKKVTRGKRWKKEQSGGEGFLHDRSKSGAAKQ